MNPSTINDVQSTFNIIAPIADEAAALFYSKLFEIDPSLKPMFKGDMAAQGKKLMQILGVAVSSLNNLAAIVPAVQDLGRRHVKYGVRPQHYNTVAEAILWMLAQTLGATFTPTIKQSWTEVYAVLADTMIAAGNEA
ncbi:MAG: hemin receptor [Oleispira sp.]|nr:hemin receptor [Oleispira sp.]